MIDFQRRNPLRYRHLGLLAAGLLAFGGCASGLRSDLADRPNGAFAEGVTVARASEMRSTTADEAYVDVTSKNDGSRDTAASETPARPRGPATQAELALVGLDVPTDAELASLRGDWRPARQLTYTDARAAFVARSPAVAEAVATYRTSFERLGQIRALDDLLRQYDAFGAELKTGATTPILKPSVARSFPLGGVLDLQGRLAIVDVTLAETAFEEAMLAALARFEVVWQAAVFEQQAASILGRVAELAGRVVDAARGRYAAGNSSHASLIQAEIRATDVKNQAASARARSVAARLSLAAELDLGPDAVDGVGLRLDERTPRRPARADVRSRAATIAPSVAMARARHERAKLLVALSQRQLRPNLAEGAQIPGSAARPFAADQAYATGGAFLRELELRETASADGVRLAERRAAATADRAWATLDDALRRRASAGTQLSRAEQGVEVAERGYGAGTASYLDLDNALKLYLAQALDARAALRDAFVAAAELTRVVGVRDTRPTDLLNKEDHD